MLHAMNDTELAYMAGIVDGEGSITVSYRRRKQYGDVQARIGLSVYNSDMRLLHWIKQRFEGSIHVQQRLGHWKPSGAWHLSDRSACSALKQLLPFLVIKSAQAELAIQFQATKMSPSQGCKSGLPQSIIEKRKVLVNKLKQLNRKGSSCPQ